jgi:hypothetical protein
MFASIFLPAIDGFVTHLHVPLIYRHDITVILLKVVLNTLIPFHSVFFLPQTIYEGHVLTAYNLI